jgi:hypothetical protein
VTDLEELADRLMRAAHCLDQMAAESACGGARHDRLKAKASGVRLALSYVEEAMRRAAA